MLLASYNPFPATSMSPYISPGPIFVHRACETYHCDGTVPEQQRRRLLSLRGFDRDHLLVDFAVVDGVKMMEGVEKLLGMGTVEYVLVYYAGPGCFAVRVDTAV